MEQALRQPLHPALEQEDPLYCATVRAHVIPYGSGLWTETKPLRHLGTACAVVTIEKIYLERGKSDAILALDKNPAERADQIRTLVGPAPALAKGQPTGPSLAFEARWASGCLSQTVGDALIARLRSQLVGYREAVGAGPEDTLVSLTLSPGPTLVSVSVQAGTGGDLNPVILGGFQFPRELFAIQEGEMGDCVPDATLGMQGARRTGAGGLDVRIELPTRDGRLCTGQSTPSGGSERLVALAWRPGGGESGWPDLARDIPRDEASPGDAALVVSIADYFALDDIPGANDNARDWVQWFREARGMDRVKTLVDSQATDVSILQEASNAVRQVEPGGTLWFVFIGHGAPGPSGDGYLLGVDAQQSPDLFYLRALQRDKLLQNLGKGQQAHTVMVLDACFSGLTASGAGAGAAAAGLGVAAILTVRW